MMQWKIKGPFQIIREKYYKEDVIKIYNKVLPLYQEGESAE